MKKPVAYLLAILVHVAILFGITVSNRGPTVAVPERKYIEVTLFTAPPTPAPVAVMPPTPKAEPPPPTPPPEVPPPPTPAPPLSPRIEEPMLAAKPEPVPPIVSPMTETIPQPVPQPPNPPAPALASPAPALVSSPVQAQPVTHPAPAAPAAGQYINTSQPSFQNRVEPEYPLSARRQHQQGSVLLGLYLNELGALDKVEIVKSSGYPLLDEAAVEAMKQSQFHPAYQDKTPVPSHAEVTITFRLE